MSKIYNKLYKLYFQDFQNKEKQISIFFKYISTTLWSWSSCEATEQELMAF